MLYGMPVSVLNAGLRCLTRSRHFSRYIGSPERSCAAIKPL